MPVPNEPEFGGIIQATIDPTKVSPDHFVLPVRQYMYRFWLNSARGQVAALHRRGPLGIPGGPRIPLSGATQCGLHTA